MDNKEFFIYLLLMAGSTYLIRAVPFALIKRKIKNPFINSFLYYIPFTVLTVMTIPAAFYGDYSTLGAALGIVTAIILAFKNYSLTVAALASSLVVFITDLILKYLIK
ncbi:MAG: AzlD domain-containing protein [Ruminococcaceae bacterium]|nr:AzlD domain-containing protein [Oscillospiraceae bacterium]